MKISKNRENSSSSPTWSFQVEYREKMTTNEMSGSIEADTLQDMLDQIESETIINTLEQTGGSIARSADILGFTERQLRLRLEKYTINPKDYRKSRKIRG